MPHLNSNRRKPAASAVAVLVLLLACLGLAACGNSSGSSSSTAGTSAATTTTGAAGAIGPSSGRFAALRECLQKNGVTLPAFKPGQHGQPQARGPFGAGSAARLPKGVTRAQYEAALKKCGGGGNFAGRGGSGGARFKSPAFQAALAKFATCLRQNGVNVPAPNTSGKGPVFDTKGIDTSSAKFKAAEAKCQSDLSAAFRRGRGGAGSGAGGPAGGNGSGSSGGSGSGNSSGGGAAPSAESPGGGGAAPGGEAPGGGGEAPPAG
jgi:hypothetical protein